MGKFERAYSVHEEVDDEVLAIAHSPTAQCIFTGGNHGVVRKWAFWGVRQLQAEYKAHTDAVVCFAVDGHFLYSGSVASCAADGRVVFWDPQVAQPGVVEISAYTQ